MQLGEVDAAWSTAPTPGPPAPKVNGIEFPSRRRRLNDYPIVALTEAPNPAGARAFVDYVLSADGEGARTAGFAAP